MENDNQKNIKFNYEDDIRSVIHEKLIDTTIPGFLVEFDPVEAEMAGAFVEDSLSEDDALDAAIDSIESSHH